MIWVESLKDSGCKAPILLIGTKIDCPLTEHQVTSQMGRSFVERSGIAGFEEISARSGQNLSRAFLMLAELGLRNIVYEDSEHLNPPEWVPDNCSNRCSQCIIDFTWSTRRVGNKSVSYTY